MARIRSIHPGIFTDEAFMSISSDARVLLFGTWCEADDQGVFEWKPLTLKARILPANAVDITDLLDELLSADLAKRFEIGDRAYGVLRNFGRYQRPKTPKHSHPLPAALKDYAGATGNGIPDGPMNHTRDVTAADRQRAKRERDRQSDATRHGSSVTKVEESRQMKEGGGRRKEVERTPQPPSGALVENGVDARPADPPVVKESLAPAERRPGRPSIADQFGEWWAAYPNKVGKHAAQKSFEKVLREKQADLDTLLAGVVRYIRTKPPDRAYCNPATWLNQGRWNDEPAAAPAQTSRTPPVKRNVYLQMLEEDEAREKASRHDRHDRTEHHDHDADPQPRGHEPRPAADRAERAHGGDDSAAARRAAQRRSSPEILDLCPISGEPL